MTMSEGAYEMGGNVTFTAQGENSLYSSIKHVLTVNAGRSRWVVCVYSLAFCSAL